MEKSKAPVNLKLILTAFMLIQVACGLVTNLIYAEVDLQEDDPAALTTGEASPEPDTPTPTEEIAATETPVPTLTPTPKPTKPVLQGQTSGKLLYFTDFDSESNLSKEWSVFSEPSDLDYEYSLNEDGVFVGIPDMKSIVLMINTASLEDGLLEDVYIETRFESLSDHDSNNLSLICRFSEKGWYEFRLLRGGEWEIWKFSDDEGDYVRLDDDRAPRLIGNTPSTIGAKCSGDTLTLYFDGQPVPDATVTDAELTDGAVGMSVFTIFWEQVAIEIDYFGVSGP